MFKTKDRQSIGGSNVAIGESLRAAREARGMSYAEVSEDCKLQERFIEALEAGHTDYLPAHIYFRMFSRMYAETLGVDPDQLLGRLYPEAPEPEFGSGFSDASRSVSPIEPVGEVISLDTSDPDDLLAAAISNQSELNLSSKPVGSITLSAPVAPIATAPPVSPIASIAPLAPSRPIGQAPAPIAPQYVPDRSAPGGSSAGVAVANLFGSYNKSLKVAGALSFGVVAVLVLSKFGVFNDSHAEEASGAAKDTITTSATSTAAALEELGLSNYNSAEELELTIRARSATGIIVVADGDTLFNRKLEAGEALTWKSDYRFRIDISDKENVELFVAGEKLKSLPGKSDTVNGFEINQLNYQELLLSAPSGD